MTEEGILSIVRRGTTSQVRDASSNPHAMERQPYPCPDEGTLFALRHHCGLGAWSLHRALAELRYGRMAVLPIVLSEAQRQRYFPHPQGSLTSARTAEHAVGQGEH
jgi:hypothetical protein